MRKLGINWIRLIPITLIFLSSCVGYGSDFKGVLAPEYPTPPEFELVKQIKYIGSDELEWQDGWWMSHSDKVDLQDWIIRIGGFRDDCTATIGSMGK